jgi:hypothetical protein
MLTIAPMTPGQTAEYAAIWVPWLQSMDRTPEPEDLAIMADPAARPSCRVLRTPQSAPWQSRGWATAALSSASSW